MSDFDPTTDELVSAYVDGVASPDEAARVEADPRLRARADEFRGVRAAVGTPVEVDATSRDRLISAALAAAARPDAEGDAVGATSGVGAGGATVVSLDQHRGRRRWGLAVASAAAAAVLVVVVAGGLVPDDGGDADQTAVEVLRDEESATTAAGGDTGAADTYASDAIPDTAESGAFDAGDDSAADGAATLDPLAGEAPTAPASTLTPAPGVVPSPVAVVDLGSYPDRSGAQAAVTVAVDEVLASAAADADARTAADTVEGLAADCPASLRAADPELAGVVWAGRFTVDGDVRLALLFELVPTGAVNGTHRLVEVTADTCAVRSVQTL